MDLILQNAGWTDIKVCLDNIPGIFVVDASRLLTLVMGEDWVTPHARQNKRCAPSED